MRGNRGGSDRSTIRSITFTSTGNTRARQGQLFEYAPAHADYKSTGHPDNSADHAIADGGPSA
jgi:hypothetical protein